MAPWPLVGRAEEIRRLHAVIGARGSHGMVLVGAPGVGKTRLAQEALDVAVSRGMAARQVTATRTARSVPFGAMAPLLPLEGESSSVMVSRAELLRRSVEAIVASGDGRHVALLVDDAHLLDDASATLVHHLASTGDVLVIATVRSGEPVPDPIVAMWKDGLTERLDVRELSAVSVRDLLAAVLGGPVDAASVAELVDKSHGNVLFLRELVEGALVDGTLNDDAGIWRLSTHLSPSDRLLELVDVRLAGLDADRMALLELVAFGEPLGAAELATVSKADVVDALESDGLVRSSLSGRRLEVHLAHPLYGDAARARVSALRERTMAGTLADVVEHLGARRREDVLRVASWRLLGGGGDPDLLFAGASIARARFDFSLAERLARAAGAAGGGMRAAVLAASCASLQGRTEDAERELAALLASATTDEERGLAAIARFDNVSLSTGQADIRILEEAEAIVEDPVWRDLIEVRKAGALGQNEGPRAALEAALPLLGRAHGATLDTAAVISAFYLGMMGRIEEALATSEEGYERRRTMTEPTAWYPWWHLLSRSAALVIAGQFADAEALQEVEYAHALETHSAEGQAVWAMAMCATACQRGQVRTAERLSREAAALYRDLGQQVMVRRALVTTAAALALGGRAGEAEAVLAEIDAIRLPPVVNEEVDLLQARAWAAVAGGELRRAREFLDEAARVGEASGYLVGAVAAWHGIARIGYAKPVLEPIERVGGLVEGDLSAARVVHVRALATSDAGLLGSASLAFETMGADLYAAEAAADAAAAWRRHGDPRRAANALQHAARLAERCEGASTPALQPLDTRVELTAAERETAMLAATGRSSREIAEQLHLSRRTVENRLQRVYEKLGVSGRAGLAGALTVED